MANFDFLRSYRLLNEEDPRGNGRLKHIFYPLKNEDIIAAEQELGFLLPAELEQFYNEIGYGFMNKDVDDYSFNRFIPPGNVASIRLREEPYTYDPDLDLYDDLDKLIFFEVNEGVYLSIDLTVKGDKSPVYYIKTKITDSIEEFLRAFDKDPNYFDQFGEDED